MRIGEYELDFPFGNAGGLVKTPQATEQMARTAVGFVTAGSMVLDRRVGNSPNGEVVDHYDAETLVLTNALGMPMPSDHHNPGDDPTRAQPKDFETFVREDLQAMIDLTHEHDKPFVLNFAPVTDDPMVEIRAAGTIMHDYHIRHLDGLELNFSCPNIVTPDGGRHEPLSQNPYLLIPALQVATVMREAEIYRSLGVRIAPFVSRIAVRPMVDMLKFTEVDFVAAFNTFPGGRPQNHQSEDILEVPGGIGGQSGKGMAPRAEKQTAWLMDARREAEADFAVIGSNGVFDAETMRRRLRLGVHAVSGTALFWVAENGWGAAVNKLAQDFASRR